MFMAGVPFDPGDDPLTREIFKNLRFDPMILSEGSFFP
jgi:hypothetical protein